MEEEKDKDDEEVKAEEDDDGVDAEKRNADGAEEPPAFGVEGDGGDSSVLEAAKQEVTFALLFVSILGLSQQVFVVFCKEGLSLLSVVWDVSSLSSALLNIST